jgi:uncharacterized protein YdaU (DUF1376 family)
MRAAWWWIDRWRKSTAYTDMTLAEQGAYRNLLDELWLRGGVLPADERILAKVSGDALEWPNVREKVISRFELKADGYHNQTHDEVMAKSLEFKERQRQKGLKRAEKAARGPAGTYQPDQPKVQPDSQPKVEPGVQPRGEAEIQPSVSVSVLRSPYPEPSPEPRTSTATESPAGAGPVLPFPSVSEDVRKTGQSLQRFVDVFNRAYQRRVGIPALNKKAQAQWARLRRVWGENRVLCLPILAWVEDSLKGRRPSERKPSHLMHDGTGGAWDWGQLLEGADRACAASSPECRRAWAVAKDVGLTDALGSLSFPVAPDLEVDERTPEEIAEGRRRASLILQTQLAHANDEDYGDGAVRDLKARLERGEA